MLVRKLFTPLPKSPIISEIRPRPNSTRKTSAMIRIWNGPTFTVLTPKAQTQT